MSEEEVLERKWGAAGRNRMDIGAQGSGSWFQSPWDPSRSLPLPGLVTLNEM